MFGKITSGLMVLAAMACFSVEAKALTAADYDQLAAANEQLAQRFTGAQRQTYLNAAQTYRNAAATLRAQAQAAAQQQAAKPQAPQQPVFDAGKVALSANQSWLNKASTMRPGRTGTFAVYYSWPPIYQGQTTFTPSPRAYVVTPQELYRLLQQMTNNKQRVDNIVPN